MLPSNAQVAHDNPHGHNWKAITAVTQYGPELVFRYWKNDAYIGPHEPRFYTHQITFQCDEGYHAVYVWNGSDKRWELGMN